MYIKEIKQNPVRDYRSVERGKTECRDGLLPLNRRLSGLNKVLIGLTERLASEKAAIGGKR